MSKGWEPCPRCGSNRVNQIGKGIWFLAPIFSGGCLIWIGFIFWPLWIAAIGLILLSPIGFLLPKINQCRDCKYAWRIEKKKDEPV